MAAREQERRAHSRQVRGARSREARRGTCSGVPPRIPSPKPGCPSESESRLGRVVRGPSLLGSPGAKGVGRRHRLREALVPTVKWRVVADGAMSTRPEQSVPSCQGDVAIRARRPATAQEDCPTDHKRTTLPRASKPPGLLGTTTTLSASESAISSMTLSSTVNRGARTAASAPWNASPLSTTTRAASPISAASFRADSRSALESRGSRHPKQPAGDGRSMPPWRSSWWSWPRRRRRRALTRRRSPEVLGGRARWPLSGRPVAL